MSGRPAALLWCRPGIDAFPALVIKLGALHLVVSCLSFTILIVHLFICLEQIKDCVRKLHVLGDSITW